MNIKTWFNANKVVILGLVAAIALPLNDLLTSGQTSVKVLVVSGVTAALAFLANNLRGQWQTIAGLLGTTLATYLTMSANGGSISWAQLAIQFVIAYIAVSTGPLKSRGYEHSDVITTAKQEGEEITPSTAVKA